MTKASADTTAISSHKAAQVERANESGRIPVVFVHGLWLLPNSWQRWETLFGEAGYATVAPGWPDDPETAQEAKAHPEVFAHKSVGQVADHVQAVIEGLSQKPAVIGNPANRHRAIPLTFDQFQDHTVPWAIANASYKRQRHNEGVTEIVKLEGRGHAMTIDRGWQAVAEIALNFVSRFQPTTGGN